MEPTYVVLLINLIIWVGLFTYVFSLNKTISELKDQIERIKKKQS
jgi:CcmD family protein